MSSDPEQNIKYMLHTFSARLDTTGEHYAYPAYDQWQNWNISIGDEPYHRMAVRHVPIVSLKIPEDRLDELAEKVWYYDRMFEENREMRRECNQLHRKNEHEFHMRQNYPAVKEAYDKYVAELEKYKVLEGLKS